MVWKYFFLVWYKLFCTCKNTKLTCMKISLFLIYTHTDAFYKTYYMYWCILVPLKTSHDAFCFKEWVWSLIFPTNFLHVPEQTQWSFQNIESFQETFWYSAFAWPEHLWNHSQENKDLSFPSIICSVLFLFSHFIISVESTTGNYI